jgi:glycosyltransferase involved in cell wall biosynthesis
MQWVNLGQIKDKNKIRVVMEASSPFSPIDKKQAQATTGAAGSKNYLWVGRLDQNKDPLLVARAFAKSAKTRPDIHLYMIYQSQELEPELKVIANESNANIHLVGKVEHDRLFYWYNSADFIISSSHYEGSGVAVCEAMSCGCIPIVTDIPSFRMMTANGTIGLLYPPGNEDSLLKAIMKSLTLPATESRRVLDYFNAELSFTAIAEKMKSIIEETESPKHE